MGPAQLNRNNPKTKTASLAPIADGTKCNEALAPIVEGTKLNETLAPNVEGTKLN